jgi:hypothetical protein
LFVLDGRRRRWTLYSPDPEYAAMSASAAHVLELTFDLFAAKLHAAATALPLAAEGRMRASIRDTTHGDTQAVRWRAAYQAAIRVSAACCSLRSYQR